jgi:hypothetical protein
MRAPITRLATLRTTMADSAAAAATTPSAQSGRRSSATAMNAVFAAGPSSPGIVARA